MGDFGSCNGLALAINGPIGLALVNVWFLAVTWGSFLSLKFLLDENRVNFQGIFITA
jgi:hypothetical protein